MWQSLVPLCALLVIVVDLCVEAFLIVGPAGPRQMTAPAGFNDDHGDLVPSQIMARLQKQQQAKQDYIARNLVPSQVIHYRVSSMLKSTAEGASTSSSFWSTTQQQQQLQELQTTKPSIRSRRRMRPKKKKESETKPGTPVELPTTGNFPDPWYRAISMDHLRCHPRFVCLPKFVASLQTLEDAGKFRQDSWQWDALHEGRCTTSQAAAALGFFEPTAAATLGVPVAWRRGGRGAYHRLTKKPLRTLSDMRNILLEECAGTNGDGGGHEEEEEVVEGGETYWQTPSLNSDVSFLADYLYQPNAEEYSRRKKFIRERSGGDYLDTGIRLIWGNTQEATALLTALNYFGQKDDDMVLEESGMRGASLSFDESSLLVGATPDGVLRYGDGTTEVLEVKNHCPFFSNKGRKRRGGKVKAFSIGDRLVQDGGIFPQYVSQLQMEMLCLGPHCRSAIMVRQTATQGAVLLRMYRDEDWIQEMLHFLHRFQSEFVQELDPPPVEFFWNNPSSTQEQSRYRRFVNRTAELRNQVKIVAHIPNDSIQRVQGEAPFFLD